MVFFIVLSNSAAIALFGWTGLPWQLSVRDGGFESAQSRRIGEQGVGVGMGVAGVTAAAYLDHLNALGFEILESLFERKVAQKAGKYA